MNITRPQRHVLRKLAFPQGTEGVGYGAEKRILQALADKGLAERVGLTGYRVTAAGLQTLQDTKP